MKNGIFLRINVGERKYVYAKVQAGWKKGLGLEERIPDNYVKFLNTLTVEELEELKEHIKKDSQKQTFKEKAFKRDKESNRDFTKP
ncbi:hypothetical protein M2349_001672 [Caldanaerobacter subterraneus subsp. tengcongensis MB4]|uniref:Uncharacterized protein n=1 Tax=Caldanaerobacter subterraneus subsp. tengcongensis (strain DSM 15242 / JCM 11007 / NBRC 100824 / MB4) TaxID=273068 RepID=Q8RBW6_CALS4|nr:hypothetical protein TTE0692 [Caldanaerobacter subterraneus subsp. tengcongensis MB4]MCS3916531.1 hypothetical protein [Caldanaerobacter subterraneus subsp. tengcongensis MB4]